MINDNKYSLNNYEKIIYTFPLLKYHNRWNSKLGIEDFRKLKSKKELKIYKGFYFNNQRKKYTKKDGQVRGLNAVANENQEYIKKIKDICESNGIKLYILEIPSKKDPFDFEEATKKLAENLKIDYIDIDSNIINWNTDTSDAGEHLNYIGAEKISKYIGNWIQDNNPITPHENSDWDNGLIEYEKQINSK